MQTATILLALGGDTGNTVQKHGVTAAEIAVLRVIHGDEAVTDVEPGEDVKRSHREERARLLERYGRQQDGRFISPAVEALFPGVAARVFETLDELDLPEEFFKAESRVTSTPKKAAARPPAKRDREKPVDKAPVADDGQQIDTEVIDAPNEDADVAGEDADNDGIGDINDDAADNKMFE